MQKRLFSELGLSDPILKAVEKLGFEQTSPIQSAAIPVLLSGRDVVGQSATGSGKTAAFAIPAIEKIPDTSRQVEVLVLTPTRELAMQVAEEFARLAAFRPKLHAVPIYGGASYERQFSELRKGPQVVIGTPGRIIDHLQRKTLDLSKLRMVVLDECDRMLDMGFREDMEIILAKAPKSRQTVFFSATLPPPIRRLIEDFSNQPEHVKIESSSMTVPTVTQEFFDIPARSKLDTLTRLLDLHDARLCLVFANTQRAVDDIAEALIARGYSTDRLHGGMSQAMRTRTMANFKKSAFDVLVATDVAGRGIDVDDLDLVINFDLPYDPEDYVHRIGRTGRAGREGKALTLISGREIYRLQAIERFTRQRIKRGRVPTWDEVEEKRMSSVLDKVRATLEAGRHAPHAATVDRMLDEGIAATDLAAALLQELLLASGMEVKGTDPKGSESKSAETTAPKAAKKSAEEAKPPRSAKSTDSSKPAKESTSDEVPESPAQETTELENAAAEESETLPNAAKQQHPEELPTKLKAGREAPRPIPPPAAGYQWIWLTIGKNRGLGPRDVVDIIADVSPIGGDAVGLIKLFPDETFAEIRQEFAEEIAEALDEGELDGHVVEVKLVEARRGAKSESFSKRPRGPERPHRRFDNRPPPRGKGSPRTKRSRW